MYAASRSHNALLQKRNKVWQNAARFQKTHRDWNILLSFPRAAAYKFRSLVDRLEYSSDEVPGWFNYAAAPTLHGKKRMPKVPEAPKWIELEDTE